MTFESIHPCFKVFFFLLFETGFVRRRQGNNWTAFFANCGNSAITLPGVADWTSMDFAGMNSKASITVLVLNVACDGGRIVFCLMYSLCLSRLQTSVMGLSDSLMMCLLWAHCKSSCAKVAKEELLKYVKNSAGKSLFYSAHPANRHCCSRALSGLGNVFLFQQQC